MEGFAWCLIGLATLVAGSEVLVRRGTKLAILAGVPPIVIGLTVVAVGTSAPELAIGVEASLQGKGSLAIGNIAGTNTVNILLILGLSALLVPLPLQMRTLRYDLPAMAIAAGALLIMAMDGVLTRLEGVILLAGAVLYTVGIVATSKREGAVIEAEFAEEFSGKAVDPAARDIWGILSSFVLLVLSIAAVVKGADWLVYGASHLARQIGVSDAFIGLTIVAVGTSAPELVTTLVSTLRNERDIAIGNLIGSSAYNILAILGLTALFPENGIAVERDLILVDIPVSGLATIACIPIFVSERRVTRIEGALFVGAYFTYLAYLVFARG